MSQANMKLGKLPPKKDPRTLHLSRYLDIAALPPAPIEASWGSRVPSWGMMLNDSLGDCTCAAAGHMEMLWSADEGKEYVPPDADILAVYEAVGGYVPGDPNTDNGCVAMDVLNYWRKTGISNHKIAAYMSVNPMDKEHVKQAIFLFGGIYIGVALPLSAQNQNPWHQTGTPEDALGSWGGHAIPVVEYDEAGLTCVTWGQLQRMSWGWFAEYVDEAYAVLSEQWLGANNIAPNKFNLAQLQSDLAAL